MSQAEECYSFSSENPPRDVVSSGTPNCPALLIGKEESFRRASVGAEPRQLPP